MKIDFALRGRRHILAVYVTVPEIRGKNVTALIRGSAQEQFDE